MNEIYRERLRARITAALTEWRDGEPPDERTVYQFFHGLKGTAATLGLLPVSEIADNFMALYGKDRTAKLPKEEVEALSSQLRMMLLDQLFLPDADMKFQEQTENQVFVLLIDDDMEFANFTKECLESEDITVIVAPSGKKGLELFYSVRPNFIILDLELPDMDGFELLEKLSRRARKSFVPITVLMADAKKEHRIRAFNLGATDFIGKPINPDVFLPFIQNRLAYKEDIQKVVIMDELTGAYNRRYLTNILPRYVTDYKRGKDVCSLVLLDLDRFKWVNDTFGHSVGDYVLRECSQAMKKSIREQDGLFRYGGEEFALLLPSTSKEEAQEIVSRIKTIISKIPFNVNGEEFNITFSAGITETTADTKHAQALIEEADKALYFAKENGRNRVCIYNSEVMKAESEKILEVIVIDSDPLIRAMVTKQFSNWVPDHFTIRISSYWSAAEFLRSDWYRPEQYYMILLDGAVPKADRQEMLHRIRSKFTSERALIAMLISRDQDKDILESLQGGADDFMLKPFQPQEVVQRVQRLTGRYLH